jgi:hypothetical protein
MSPWRSAYLHVQPMGAFEIATLRVHMPRAGHCQVHTVKCEGFLAIAGPSVCCWASKGV